MYRIYNAKAEVTNSTADTDTVVEGAKASNTLTTARGTRLTRIDAGDDTNISASVGISTGAEANAATGDSEAINKASDIAALELTSSEPTETARVQKFDADGIISAESALSSTADASTTSGTASAVDNFGVVDAVQLGDSTINVGGDSTISGSVDLSSSTNAVNVGGGDVSAGSAVESSSGINQDNTPEKGPELSIQGDASLTGTVNSNKTVTAESTEGNATATTGAIDGANQFGIDLQSLIVEGNANLTGQVSNNETTTTESTKGDSTSIAFGTDRIGLQAYSLETKGEATIKATNSSSNDVSAGTTQGDAFAVLGNDVAAMRNIAMDNSVIKSGNDTTITAATFGESQATAESVKESANAVTISEAIGVYQSAFESGGEFDITSTAVNAGNVTASTVGDGIETLDQASAFANLKAQAINLENLGSNDLGLETAGNANVTASGGIQTDVTSKNTDGDAIAKADLEALGMQIENGSIGGDANIQTVGLIDISNISAETTSSGEAVATAEIAVNSLEVTDGLIVGGKADFISQTTSKVNIESDNINKGDATSSNQALGEDYSVAGMQLNGLDLASDSTFASILIDEFNTSAKTVDGNAAANTNQSLLGIGFQGADNMASGDVSISSVMSHTSFTEASSVQGIATVEDKLSAVGIEIDAFDIDGDASISSNVVVRASSSTES